MYPDNERLHFAIEAAKRCEKAGIGRLSEKTLHSVLKYYFEPDENFHEVKIGGYYADIANGEGITEIQTASFGNLRAKLKVFLPSWRVNIVYPVAEQKYLHWVDPISGEITPGRKSPKKGNIFEIAKELVYIKPLLQQENLSFTVVLMDIDEYKLLNGFGEHKKIRASKYERYPREITGVHHFGMENRFSCLLPLGLPSPFSTKEYKIASGVSPKMASAAVNVLKSTGVIVPVGKKGNLIFYEIAPNG